MADMLEQLTPDMVRSRSDRLMSDCDRRDTSPPRPELLANGVDVRDVVGNRLWRRESSRPADLPTGVEVRVAHDGDGDGDREEEGEEG